MLEIRYNKTTKELTGWWNTRHGNHEVKLKNRPDEAMAMLDMGIPDKEIGAWLFDKPNKKLIPNPGYVEPKPSRDFATEIDLIKTEVAEILTKVAELEVEVKKEDKA